jgi:hypothetical protein
MPKSGSDTRPPQAAAFVYGEQGRGCVARLITVDVKSAPSGRLYWIGCMITAATNITVTARLSDILTALQCNDYQSCAAADLFSETKNISQSTWSKIPQGRQ